MDAVRADAEDPMADAQASYVQMALQHRLSGQPRTGSNAAAAYSALSRVYRMGPIHSASGESMQIDAALTAPTAASTAAAAPPILLVGLGQPILDISCEVESAMLDRYGLAAANCVLAEPTRHGPLYAELAARPAVQYFAGGSGLNTVRCAEWWVDQESFLEPLFHVLPLKRFRICVLDRTQDAGWAAGANRFRRCGRPGRVRATRHV